MTSDPSAAKSLPPSTPSNPSAVPDFPHLAISDLLVLTLSVAYGMAWTQALGDQRLPGNGSQLAERLVEAATDALNGTLIGAQVFGFSVAVRELFRGRPLSSLAPGHWWFLISAPQ